MTNIERNLALALLSVWPRCAYCTRRAEYRPASGKLHLWSCEEHKARHEVMFFCHVERVPGYEAMVEVEGMLADEQALAEAARQDSNELG